MKEANSGLDNISEAELLSKLIKLAGMSSLPDELAKDLLDKHLTINNLISSSPKDLMLDKQCGERLAVLLSSLGDIRARILEQRNESITHLETLQKQKDYFSNLLMLKGDECIIIVTLDSRMKIIGQHLISRGNAGFSSTRPQDIAKLLIADKPSSIIVGHNHPSASAVVSPSDVSFTISLCEWVESFDVKLREHIIVGEDETRSFSEQGFSKYLSR